MRFAKNHQLSQPFEPNMLHLLQRARPSSHHLRSLVATTTLRTTSPLPALLGSSNFFSTTRIVREEASEETITTSVSSLVHHPTGQEATANDVFAVVKVSGSQYKVTLGDVLTVNKVVGATVGETMHLDDVLLVGTPNETIIGRPLVPNARVTVAVEEQTKDKKIIVFKKTRRQGYQRKNGARREITVFRVSDITY